jgi:PAS domain S-box-containing protein
MLGWEPHEMIGRHLFDFMDDEWRAVCMEGMRRRERGVTESHDFKFIRRDGSELWVILSAKPLMDEGGAFIGALATVTDVTERRRIEAALRESEERFQEMASAVREVFWMVEARESKALYVSPGFDQIWGVSRDLISQDVANLIASVHPEDRHIVVRALERRSLGLDTTDEYRIVRPDGGVRWIRDRSYRICGGPAGELRFAGIAEDITERKCAEEALRRSHEDLELRVTARTEEIRKANADLLAEIDRRREADRALNENRALYLLLAEHSTETVSRHSTDSTLLYISPACRALLGYEPEDLIGHPAIEFVHPEDVDRVLAYFQGVLSGTGNSTVEFRFRKKDGIYTWIEKNCKRVVDPITREVVEVIAVARDVSDRKVAEERERRLNAELAHVDRLAAMGEMATGLAHELNQPLSAIVNYLTGSVHYIASSPGGSPEVVEALGSAAAEARRAGAIIHRLREFVRRRDPSESTVLVNDVVHDVISLAAAELRAAQVRPRIDVNGAPTEVLGDRIQIAQVLLNLVRNAVDAMREIPPPRRALAISCTTEADGAVKVVVRDSGVGLSPEVLTRLFEPFVTTKREGMGMGLAICKSIIAAHHGKIWAEPDPAGGTAVGFLLPPRKKG